MWSRTQPVRIDNTARRPQSREVSKLAESLWEQLNSTRLRPRTFGHALVALLLLLLLIGGCAPRQDEHVIRSGNVTLSATIYWPRAVGPHPGIVMIHGSGPDTRDNYRLYADMFARKGFAVLIYDKRGLGGSSGDWRTSPFGALADDAAAALRYLRRQPRIAADGVGLWGGSEGAVVALQMASAQPGAAFIILQSATGVTFAEQNLFQTQNQLRAMGLPREEVLEALRFQRLKHGYARTGRGWPEYAAALWRSRSEPWGSLGGLTNPQDWWWAWYRTKMDVNPAALAEHVRVPVFAVWGEADALVPVAASREALSRAFARAGNASVTTLVVSGADHSINTPSGPNPSPIYTDAMFEWGERLVSNSAARRLR